MQTRWQNTSLWQVQLCTIGLIALIAAGIGLWGAILLAPAAQPVPPTLQHSTSQRIDTSPLANWFGNSATTLSTQIAVIGLIQAHQHGVAVLSIDGAAPQAFRINQELVPGTVLREVHANAITLDQNGQTIRIQGQAPTEAPTGISIKP